MDLEGSVEPNGIIVWFRLLCLSGRWHSGLCFRCRGGLQHVLGCSQGQAQRFWQWAPGKQMQCRSQQGCCKIVNGHHHYWHPKFLPDKHILSSWRWSQKFDWSLLLPALTRNWLWAAFAFHAYCRLRRYTNPATSESALAQGNRAPEIADKVRELVQSLLPEALSGTLKDPSGSKLKTKAQSREASAEPAQSPSKSDSVEDEDLTRYVQSSLLSLVYQVNFAQ